MLHSVNSFLFIITKRASLVYNLQARVRNWEAVSSSVILGIKGDLAPVILNDNL